jgi:hypothetical protein
MRVLSLGLGRLGKDHRDDLLFLFERLVSEAIGGRPQNELGKGSG